MKVSVESLLEPISADKPCGEPIEYDPEYEELSTMLQGKPETQFAAAEEPDWKAVNNRCIELFRRSKDLNLALRLTLSTVNLEGVAGFRDGILVIKGLIERYWETLYPRLDPDDNNDPLERVNILASLTTPMGTFGDPYQVIKRLRKAPLADSLQMGQVRMVDIDRANSGAPAEGETVMTASQVQAAFRSTPPEKLKLVHAAITESESAVKELDLTLTKLVGAANAVSFDALLSALKDMQKAVGPFVGEEAKDESQSSSSTVEGTHTESGPGISGSIRSRQDVIRVLDQICDFFRRTEPSSPVPLILQRARRLVDLDFMGLLTDLAPESLTQIKHIAGIRDAGAQDSSNAPAQ